ncbi:glycosyltransferase family 2 protein [Streptomyces sp. I05A-00742]|uniref:glycosyltransferase n=1 Tax=Streptomyces sp. I05A-00742 TaxID=2732853 RepID=UPI001489F4F4|nr:glycosyltransferase family A protein [Streptomyces sp. I05A-00742]
MPTAQLPPGKVSYCTTCKNRLWQLSETLPDNLRRVVEAGNSEIVLVNYNSDDELDTWVRRFERHIESGILRYLHQQTEPYFHASKAKNLAHLAATGQYLVNLDADNYIGDTIPTWRALWEEDPHLIIRGFSPNADGRLDPGNGSYGRIGLSRTAFDTLGGYDEGLLAMGCQDRDLVDRARAHGMRVVRVDQRMPFAIRNTDAEKVKYTGSSLSWYDMWQENIGRAEKNLRLGRLTVNQDRTPVKVLLNFSQVMEL